MNSSEHNRFLEKKVVVKFFRKFPDRGSFFSSGEIQKLLDEIGGPARIKNWHIILARFTLPLVVLLLNILLFPNCLILGLMFSVALYFTPGLLLKYAAENRRKKVLAEQGLFSQVIFMSLQAGLTLKEAIEEASLTTNFLKPFLLVCLNEWHTDRVGALQGLKRKVGVSSFQIIIDLLIQAANLGDKKITEFLEENKKLEDEIKNLEITAKAKTRPLILTFQMLIPLGAILMLLFYPLLVQTDELLRNF